jgi:hypothetical protein
MPLLVVLGSQLWVASVALTEVLSVALMGEVSEEMLAGLMGKVSEEMLACLLGSQLEDVVDEDLVVLGSYVWVALVEPT